MAKCFVRDFEKGKLLALIAFLRRVVQTVGTGPTYCFQCCSQIAGKPYTHLYQVASSVTKFRLKEFCV